MIIVFDYINAKMGSMIVAEDTDKKYVSFMRKSEFGGYGKIDSLLILKSDDVTK